MTLDHNLDPEKLDEEQMRVAIEGFVGALKQRFTNNKARALYVIHDCLQPPHNEQFSFVQLKFMKYVLEHPEVLDSLHGDEPAK